MYESKKLKKFVVDYVTEYVASVMEGGYPDDFHVIGPVACLYGESLVQPVVFGFKFLVALYKDAFKTLHVRQIGERLAEHLPDYLMEGTERVYNAHEDWAVPNVFMWTPEGEVSCEDGSLVDDIDL